MAAGGLVALLIGLIPSSGAVAGCILGTAVAVGLGFVLKVPDARVVEEVARVVEEVARVVEEVAGSRP